MLQRLRNKLRAVRRFVRGDLRRPIPRVMDPEAALRVCGPQPQRLLEGRRALVTGVGRNIGRAIALEMAAHGADVVGIDLDPEACRRVEAELPSGHMFAGDVSRVDAIDALWHTLKEQDLAVDLLVHNASYQPGPHGLVDSQPAMWERTFATNILGPVHLTRLFAQDLAARQKTGTVVFISSVHQWITGGWPAYSASKAALGMALREIALDLAPLGIRVNAIAPGWVAEPHERHAFAFDHAPLGGRAIPPIYVARAAVYLAADYFSAFTTGGVLQLDAGLSLRSYRTPSRGSYDDPHIRK